MLSLMIFLDPNGHMSLHLDSSNKMLEERERIRCIFMTLCLPVLRLSNCLCLKLDILCCGGAYTNSNFLDLLLFLAEKSI